jgi:hypothetical protein
MRRATDVSRGVESTARSCQKHLPAGAVLDTGDLLGEASFEKRGIIQTMHHPKGELRMPASRGGSTAPRRR